MSDQNKDAQWVFVAEITVAVDDVGTLQTHYACSGEGFATRPGDTPAHTVIPPTLLDPGSLRREMFSGDKPFGAVRPAFGEVSLYNGDGRYDGWEHYGFDGRDFVLRWGPLAGAYPADFVTVVICTVEGITLTETEARLKLRDNTQLLDKSFLKDAFDGSSVAEGIGGLAGQAKPRYINAPRWCGPQPHFLATTFGGVIFFVTAGKGMVTRVWDNGNELQHSNVSGDFWGHGNDPAPGNYWYQSFQGGVYLRLGTKEVGDLRVYASGSQANGLAWTMQALLAEIGYTGPVLGTPISEFGTVVADPGITYARIFDDAAAAAGMWYGFDRLGRFVSKVFDAPSGAPLMTLHRGNCTSIKRSPVQGMEVPLYQMTANVTQTWKSNYTAPTNYARANFDADQWLARYSYSDDSVRVKHPSARSLKMDMLIGPRGEVEWQQMCARYMTMFGVDRSTITATVALTPEMLDIDLGDCVRVQWPRFNLAAGRLFRVIALRYALRARQLEIVLWG